MRFMRKARYFIIAGIVLLDQSVKFAVRHTMYVGQSIPIIGDVFHLTYVQNTGAAFSLFEGRFAFLTMIPLLALLFAVWYMEKHKNAHITLILSLVLIIPGGFGNLLDRITLGYVTDMFDFRFWPVFNIADIAICLGCVFLVVYIFFYFDRPEKADMGEECES